MLKKLLKYDWTLYWRTPAIINIFLLIITGVGVIFLISPLWKLDDQLLEYLKVLAGFFYVVSIFAGSMAVTIYIAIRYYKNLYTDEGYLTNTLPVAPWQIILSKLLISVAWNLITGIVVMLSVFALFMAFLRTFDSDGVQEVLRNAPEIMQFLLDFLDMNAFTLILFSVVYTVISTTFSVLMIFSAIALGQLFTGHRVAGAVLWYILQYVVVQIASAVFLNAPIMLFNVAGFTRSSGSTFIRALWSGQTLATILGSLLLFFIAESMLRRNLNLE
ncbi:MAG: hypothetical protein MR430_04215 [Lachnospiraceae bacterium]|nr:hypothetical protein [Lachnospiraceae bacterium]